jgi:hypothetical protein
VDFVVRNTGDRPVFLNLDLHPCNGGPPLQRRESEGWTYVQPVGLCTGPGPGSRLQLLDPDGVFVGALSDSFYPGRPSPEETSEGGPNLLVDGAYRLVWGVALSAEPGAGGEGLPLFSNSFVVSLVP